MTQVIKGIIKIVLIVLTIAFAFLTIERMMLDYNENGVYFDGCITYDTDAVVVYGFVTGTLLVITTGVIILWKKVNR